jgi:hypothetical protein
MPASLVTGAIKSRLGNHPDERSLVTEILQAVKYAEDVIRPENANAYTHALAYLATKALQVPEIIKRLSLPPRDSAVERDHINDALAAALHLSRDDHASICLHCGTQPQIRTRSFGE